MKVKTALTLLELLVVIAIVVALLLILVPIFRRAIESSHITRRKAHFSQLSKALELYRQDYDGGFPGRSQIPGQTWLTVMEKYVGDRGLVAVEEFVDAPNLPIELGKGVGLNACLSLNNQEPELNPIAFYASAILVRSATVGTLSVSYVGSIYGYCPDSIFASVRNGQYSPVGGQFLAEYFSGGAVYSRLDGSARWIPARSLMTETACGCAANSQNTAFFETDMVTK